MIEIQKIEEKEKAWLVGIYNLETPKTVAQEHITELALLADTAGAQSVGQTLQHREKPDRATYLGKGKIGELAGEMATFDAGVVIFDDDLSPTQARNIEKELKTKVLDRSGLILDIFAGRAQTSTAKTQVELAQLEYLLPRLTRYWSHLSRQKGGIGTKGPGETQLETDRRLVDRRIAVLKQKLEKISRQRETQRSGRRKIHRIALVGYTNAGKSSLMNALTDAQVYIEDQLFATLDATVRRHEIEGRPCLLSDTVGFIRKLPHGLVESFKSTLEEVVEADLLLHVVDASNPFMKDAIEVVEQTLSEIGAVNKTTLLVLNKIDKLSVGQLRLLKEDYPDGVFISAWRQLNLSALEKAIDKALSGDYIDQELLIPYSHYHLVAQIHGLAEVIAQKEEEAGCRIQFRIRKSDRKKLMSQSDISQSE